MKREKSLSTAILKAIHRVYSLLGGILKVKLTYLDAMKENQFDGFVMKNESNGVKVNCTQKFVEYWKQRGFKIVEQKSVALWK